MIHLLLETYLLSYSLFDVFKAKISLKVEFFVLIWLPPYDSMQNNVAIMMNIRYGCSRFSNGSSLFGCYGCTL